MSRKRFTAEKIIGMLRESEVFLAQGKTVGEAKIVIENWRREYNTVRPYSNLNGLPPAPEAVLQLSFQSPS